MSAELSTAGLVHALSTVPRPSQAGGAREEYAEEYWRENVTLDYVTRCAPFVANELRRQNRLRAGDV